MLSAIGNFPSGFGKATPKLADSSPESGKATPKISGINQFALMNKRATFREKKSFKSFSELVIHKERVKKVTKRDFVSAMNKYLQDIESVTDIHSDAVQGRQNSG